MKKIPYMVVLLFSLSAGWTLRAGDHHEQYQRKTHGMPEPSAIPEFAVGAVGLGYLAWRRRKRPA